MLKILILICLLTKVIAQDWCNVPYCSSGQHIACGHTGQFAQSCSSPSQVTLSTANIDQILHKHNDFRSLVASGRMTGFQGALLPQATRMAKMRWSNELAELAALNTKQCRMNHDACRGTSQFNFAGQNLAIRYDFSINVTMSIDILVDLWINEQAYVRFSDIQALQGVNGGNGQVIGHWTTMANEKMTHIGCAMSTFNTVLSGTSWRTALLACNYAFTNFLGRRVYQSGTTASHCVSGTDSAYAPLCSIHEPIDVNDWNRMK